MPERLIKRISDDFDLKPVVATEIEFYLHGASLRFTPEAVIAQIETSCKEAGIKLAGAEAERGPDQYEVSLLHTDNILRLIEDTERFKLLMHDTFARQEIRADFSAKPMKDAPGSGLHVHVHLEDASGLNVYFREDDSFSPQLLHSIGGLLALLNPCMSIFAPKPESYDRFNHTVNAYLVCPTAANIPLTVSWGTNNRTVAVRLPPKDAHNKHLEHRVAGSDADVTSVIDAILMGIHYGLMHKSDPGEPVYGDATLPQYGLLPLVRSLEEANKAMLGDAIWNTYKYK